MCVGGGGVIGGTFSTEAGPNMFIKNVYTRLYGTLCIYRSKTMKTFQINALHQC